MTVCNMKGVAHSNKLAEIYCNVNETMFKGEPTLTEDQGGEEREHVFY